MKEQPPVQFQVEVVDESRLGRLDVPTPRIAEWLNFLVSPKQGVTIISAEQDEAYIRLYFLANERLYSYLDGQLNCEVRPIHPENVMVGKALQKRLKVS